MHQRSFPPTESKRPFWEASITWPRPGRHWWFKRNPKVNGPSAGIMTHAKCNFGPLGCSLSFSIGADGWRWGEERKETAEEIEAANIARRECERRKGSRKAPVSKKGRTPGANRRGDPNLPGEERGGGDFHQRVERQHRGQKRHHRRRVERVGPTKAIEAAQERQTESVVEPGRRGDSRVKSKPSRGYQNRFPKPVPKSERKSKTGTGLNPINTIS